MEKINLSNVSLIIATFNEEESLTFVLDELKNYQFKEIIFVDNNSIDRTQEIIKNYKLTYGDSIKFIIQKKPGWGNAVLEGFNFASGEYLTYMDADGSYNPESILEMYELINKYDFVCASRYKYNNKSEDDTFIRALGNKLFTLLTKKLLKLNLSDSLFFFPLIKTSDFYKINPKSTNFGICIEIPYLLKKENLTYTDFLSLERKRFGGISKVNALTDGFKILIEVAKIKFN